MDETVFNETLNKIQEKIGEEQAAIIADDLGTLKTAQKTALEKQAENLKKIEDLTTTNKQLIASNANLLNKIPVNEENKIVPPSQITNEEKEETYVSPFDEFGRLKK